MPGMEFNPHIAGSMVKKGAAVVLIAAVLALLALWGTSNQYTEKFDVSFSMQRVSEVNPASEGNEIWFQSYAIDDQIEMAAALGVPDGWHEYAGYLHIVPGDSTVESLYIRCQASDIQLYLYHAPSAGMLLLENESGQQQIIDLYAEEGYYEFVPVRLTFPVHEPEGAGVFFLLVFAAFLILGLLTAFVSRRLIGGVPLLLAFFLFYHERLLFHTGYEYFISFVLALVAGVICSVSLYDGQMEKYRRPGPAAGILFAAMYAAFALVGYPLILQAYTVTLTRYTLSYWLLLSVFMVFLVMAALWCFEQIGRLIWEDREKAPCQGSWRFWALFGCTMASFPLWLIACFPANMPSDTISIWEIIHGDRGYLSGHPYCYYKTMELLVKMLKDPSIVAWVQFAFFALVTAAFLHYLCKKGLSFRFALLWSVLFTLIPCNGIGQVTLLKDYPQATALLWLTCLLVQIIWDGEKAVTPKNLAALAAALLMCALYRHNGVIAFAAVILYLWFLARKYARQTKRLVRAVLCGVLAAFFAVNAFVSVRYGSSQASGLMNYLILENAASVAASGDRLSDSSMQMLEKYGTWEEWAEAYRPFAHNAPGDLKVPLIDDFMEGKTTADIIPLLVDSIVHAPFITVKTRLNKLNIMWGLKGPPGRQLFAHLSVYPNEYGVVRGQSALAGMLLGLFDISSDASAAMLSLFFHPGLYLILLLIMGIKLCCDRAKKALWCLLPLAGNLLSLCVSCSWQDFRYFYFIIPLSLFVLLTGTAYGKRNH